MSTTEHTEFDIMVIGGGINGCGIARDAAGRGYSVCLAEMNDLASGTSSWSSKLIHGGFRYLEYFEFRLVREALSEREILLKMAPHIIWPMRFVLPHHRAMRPAWLLRLGLFLYDHIGKRKLLPGTKTVNLKTANVGEPLKPTFTKGFEYSDCWVNDARLVVLNAMDAAKRGAKIHTHTEFLSAERHDDRWLIQLKDLTTDTIRSVKAKVIVNAAGPWVDNVLGAMSTSNSQNNVRLVQGSHIVVPKLHQHDRAYMFQNPDRRVIFAIPYEEDFTLIGTTDQDYAGDPGQVAITPEETKYLCEAASEYFKTPIRQEDVVWSYSGVRPLYDDGASEAQEATRDYVLRADGTDTQPRVLNIFGGKITTYRKLAEAMLSEIEELLGKRNDPWTATSPLPGGDFAPHEVDALISQLHAKFGFLRAEHVRRLIRAYGTDAFTLMGEAKSADDLGRHFGADLYEREVEYLREHEWARTADDVLFRRTKLGIRFPADGAAALRKYFDGTPSTR
ncbi:MAG: glycerol-3-phosphate dehydrogenase [Gammaproteobacteria bacterium]|nr:glycerol-3-phosphate dehydrogenase [Gammaproteobacteria bacterium]